MDQRKIRKSLLSEIKVAEKVIRKNADVKRINNIRKSIYCFKESEKINDLDKKLFLEHAALGFLKRR